MAHQDGVFVLGYKCRSPEHNTLKLAKLEPTPDQESSAPSNKPLQILQAIIIMSCNHMFCGVLKYIAYIPDHSLVQLHINFTLPIFFWATFLDRAVNTKAPCRLGVVWVACIFGNLQKKVPCRFREMWVVCTC